jgi:hypothetical protein
MRKNQKHAHCWIDFEKAFDTVEWSFIEKTLQFYGFGPSLQKWIKSFYCDISSAVTNNGIASVLSKLTLSPAHSENLLKTNND